MTLAVGDLVYPLRSSEGSRLYVPCSASVDVDDFALPARTSIGSNVYVKASLVNAVDGYRMRTGLAESQSKTLANLQWNEYWYADPDFPGAARTLPVVVSCGVYVYIGTGLTSSGLVKDWWRYNVLTGAWESLTDFPGDARYGAVGVESGGKVYVGTGYKPGRSPVYYNDWYMYDPDLASWSAKTSVDASGTYGASAAALNGIIYLATGMPSGGDEWLSYSTTSDTWTHLTSFPGDKRYYGAAAALNGKLYYGLGALFSGGEARDWYVYTILSDAWTQKTDFGGSARSNVIAATLLGKVYVGLGYNGISLNDLWSYNDDDDTWTQRADALVYSSGSRASACRGKIFMGCGLDSPYSSRWHIYDPAGVPWGIT